MKLTESAAEALIDAIINGDATEHVENLIAQAEATRTEQIIALVHEREDAFLPSFGLNPAWIAGWHAAISDVANSIARTQADQ